MSYIAVQFLRFRLDLLEIRTCLGFLGTIESDMKHFKWLMS